MSKINTSYIYCILNTQTNRRYVGSTINYSHRRSDHIHRLRKGTHYSTLMQKDFNEYGENSFVIFKLEEVFTFNSDELFQHEQFWMDKYLPEYNINPKAGNTFTEFARFMSKNWNKFREPRKQTTEERQKRSVSMKKYHAEHPRTLSEHTKKLLSEINTGKGNPNFGKKRSQETRDKAARSMSKKVWNGLVSPSGIVYNGIMNLSKFAREHNLNEFSLYHVVSGKNKSHKGWTYTGNDGVLP